MDIEVNKDCSCYDTVGLDTSFTKTIYCPKAYIDAEG